MPEIPELIILCSYLKDRILNKTIGGLEVLSGKYKRLELPNANLLKKKYKVVKIESKGKLFWMTLSDGKKKIYLTSHLGMTGVWKFRTKPEHNDRLRIRVYGQDYDLYYHDPRNFGNVVIYDNVEELNAKLDKMAPDALQNNFTDKEFSDWVEERKEKYGNKAIFTILNEQNYPQGIVSGLGNYLNAEILYDAKINPHRKLKNITPSEARQLSRSIKKIAKLAYSRNDIGYMVNFDDYMKKYQTKIRNGRIPDYHPEVKLGASMKFKLKVYRQKHDPHNNPVKVDKTLTVGRSVYWVPKVQK